MFKKKQIIPLVTVATMLLFVGCKGEVVVIEDGPKIDTNKKIDTNPPNIYLYGNEVIDLEFNQNYIEPGFSALDAIDGDLTNDVSIKNNVDKTISGSYLIRYSVADKSGNMSSVSRMVNVREPEEYSSEEMKISLLGESNLKIISGLEFIELNATATNKFGDDISNLIELKSNVNANEVGTYYEKYSVNNSEGKEFSVTRVVDVLPETFPPNTNFSYISDFIEQKKPNQYEHYYDKEFKSQVRRITNREFSGKYWGNLSNYPKQGNTWNSDMSIIRLQYRFYDSKTLLELPLTDGLSVGEAYSKSGSPMSGSGDLRWSMNNPNKLFVLNSNQKFKELLINQDKTDITETEIFDFSSYAQVGFGNNEGNFDYEEQYIVITGRKDGDNSVYIILFDVKNKTEVWTKKLGNTTWDIKGGQPNYFDWITVDPTGMYILKSFNNKIFVYNKDLDDEYLLANEASHGDIGLNKNEDPVFIQFIFHNDVERNIKQSISSFNLKTHEYKELLPSKYNGGHISCRNFNRPGWCYGGFSKDGFREAIAFSLDESGIVERFAKVHSTVKNQWGVQVTPSPDGKEVIFSSDWYSGDSDSIESYLARY